MEKNRLGTSDLWVSEIGFGCMSLGSDHHANAQLLHRALDRGITFFDTADLYARGENEVTVGRAFKGMREEVIIATKVGNRFRDGQEGWDWDASSAYILEAVHKSLKRLGTDYIDLYQLHGGTLEDPIDDTIAAFETLKREGLIRHYGISSIRPNVIREYLKRPGIVSVMMQYSLFDRRPEEAVLGWLEAAQVSVIARGPLARGLLAGKEAETYLDHSQAEVQAVQRGLEPFVTPERTLGQTALRYPLAHPAVATVIPGASREAQLLENLAAANAPALTAAELEGLRALTRADRYEAHRD